MPHSLKTGSFLACLCVSKPIKAGWPWPRSSIPPSGSLHLKALNLRLHGMQCVPQHSRSVDLTTMFLAVLILNQTSVIALKRVKEDFTHLHLNAEQPELVLEH